MNKWMYRQWKRVSDWIVKDLLTKKAFRTALMTGDGLKIASAWLLELLCLTGAIWMVLLAVQSVAGAEYAQAAGAGILAGWLLILCLLADRYTNGSSANRGGVEKK